MSYLRRSQLKKKEKRPWTDLKKMTKEHKVTVNQIVEE